MDLYLQYLPENKIIYMDQNVQETIMELYLQKNNNLDYFFARTNIGNYIIKHL